MMESIFFWLALGMYVLSSIFYIWVLAFTKDRIRKYAILFAIAGLVFHSISLGMRWVVTGHGPYISTYEILSSNVWIAVLFYLLFQWRYRLFMNLGAGVMPLAFIMMGFALLGSQEVKLLTPTLRSAWLVVHIVFAKLTVAAMMVAVVLSIFYLLKQNKDEAKSGFLMRLPSLGMLDDYTYRLVAFGFITLTIMIITGAIWANNSWGSYWAWDPTETWSLVVWFVYGLYLHGRITFRWQGKISSWYVILAFVFSIIAFFVLPYFVKSLHSQYMVG